MKYSIFILFLWFSASLFSQNYSSSSKRAIKYFEEAKQHFTYKQDEEAEELLLKAVADDKKFIEAWFMLAQIFLDKNEIPKAAEYYLKGLEVDPKSNVGGFLKVAELEYKAGLYKEAKKHLDIWKSFAVTNVVAVHNATKLNKNLDFALWAIDNPVPFSPESLGDAVNTDQFEYWPSLSIDEQTLFFTVLGPPNPKLPIHNLTMQEDFYFVKRENDAWVNRTYLGAPVNTNFNEGAQSVTADGKYIYFTACNRPDGHGRLCDIYYSMVMDNGSWSEPVNLGDEINTTDSDKHPSISADGRTLYFISNRAGGKGNFDIWKSEKSGETWSKPVNLGDSINTSGAEQSPFIHPDQSTLYFSSDGWPGMGRDDIFMSKCKTDSTWSTPKNLGYPINTYHEEIGLIVNARGTKAYYSSNRRDGTDTDIYVFNLPAQARPTPVSYISGRVYDSRNYKGISATFQLIDLNSGSIIMQATSNQGEGDYLIGLPAGTPYAFNVTHPGYLFYSDHFDIDAQYSKMSPLRKDIPLDPIVTGKKIILNNIFFDSDSFHLKESSKIELVKIFEFLQLNKNVKVEISGHTDNTGSDSYNMNLSEKRAEQVVNFLVEKGINSDRLVANGYGSSQPVSSNESLEGRASNRRTELKIL